MRNADALLEVRSLRLSGAAAPALRQPLDLGVGAGDVVALGGPSGSGKTTLLRCLAGLEARAEGTLHWRERIVEGAQMPRFRRQVIYVAQSAPRFPLTAAQSLREAFALRQARTTYDHRRAIEIASQLHLTEEILERPLNVISGGEGQRVALLRALLLDPVVLLLDEPTSALDRPAREATLAALASWLDEGARALVIASHDESQLAALVTRRWVVANAGLREESVR